MVAKLVVSGILSSIFFILALYTSFLISSFFTTSLSLLKSTGTGTNLSTSNLSTLIFKLFKPIGTIGKFLIYQYLIYLQHILNELNQFFLEESDVSTLVAFLKSVFVS